MIKGVHIVYADQSQQLGLHSIWTYSIDTEKCLNQKKVGTSCPVLLKSIKTNELGDTCYDENDLKHCKFKYSVSLTDRTEMHIVDEERNDSIIIKSECCSLKLR